MFRVTIGDKTYEVNAGTRLSALLCAEGYAQAHPCGGKGICRKCRVEVNGRWVLSCEYEIHGDITVKLSSEDEIFSPHGIEAHEYGGGEQLFVLDIGTTTLVLASADRSGRRVNKIVTRPNPQRSFGADIMSRILRCMSGDTHLLHKALVDEISLMLQEFPPVDRLWVTGNTTMLHLLFGIDPSDMGTYPYTPVFLDSKRVSGAEAGIPSVTEIISLPAASAFIGADIVSGLAAVEPSHDGKFNFLIDLGTNAEIVLFGGGGALCTSAAAGPCFEGVGISCGMAATDGAIYSYRPGSIRTVGGKKAQGVCATGLIDAVAFMLDSGILDSTGYMAEGEYEIAEGVTLTSDDVRQLQTAKAAVCAAVECLMNIRGIGASDIEHVYISGGFSAHLSVDSAVKIGLIPAVLSDRCIPSGNTAVRGAFICASGDGKCEYTADNMSYTDLSSHPDFSRLFIDNMMLHKS